MLFLKSSPCHCVIIWESLLSFSKRQAFNLPDCEENLNTYLECILIAQKKEGCIMQSIKKRGWLQLGGLWKTGLYRKWRREKATISNAPPCFFNRAKPGQCQHILCLGSLQTSLSCHLKEICNDFQTPSPLATGFVLLLLLYPSWQPYWKIFQQKMAR